MKNIFFNKKYFKAKLCILLTSGFFLFLLTSLPRIGLCIENNKTIKSFNFINKPFSEVIEKISEEYNVVVLYNKSLEKLSISGVYTNGSLEKLLTRILKGKNISILTDSENDTIYIQSFGDKNQHFVASSSLLSGQRNSSFLDPYTQKTVSRLDTILDHQENNKRARLKDPNYIDPLSEKSQAELNSILKLQDINKQQRLESPSSIDPMTGKTYIELASIRKEQELKKNSRLTNSNTLDPFTGKKLSELQLIYKQQAENREKRLNNPEYIDPVTGLTMAKLNEILKIQEENKKARLGF